jgi:hypothetical protein
MCPGSPENDVIGTPHCACAPTIRSSNESQILGGSDTRTLAIGARTGAHRNLGKFCSVSRGLIPSLCFPDHRDTITRSQEVRS